MGFSPLQWIFEVNGSFVALYWIPFEHRLHQFPMELDKGEMLAMRRASGILGTESNTYASEIANVLPAKLTLWCTCFCITGLPSSNSTQGGNSGALSGLELFLLNLFKRKIHNLHLSGKTLCLTDSHLNADFHVLVYKSSTLKVLRNKALW